jgi:hypothetical protein
LKIARLSRRLDGATSVRADGTARVTSPRAWTPRAMSGVLNADRGRGMMKIYHASSIALAALAPAAAAMPEGQLAIDVALGAAMPVHSHIAMNFVRDRCEIGRHRADWDRTRAPRARDARGTRRIDDARDAMGND